MFIRKSRVVLFDKIKILYIIIKKIYNYNEVMLWQNL